MAGKSSLELEIVGNSVWLGDGSKFGSVEVGVAFAGLDR